MGCRNRGDKERCRVSPEFSPCGQGSILCAVRVGGGRGDGVSELVQGFHLTIMKEGVQHRDALWPQERVAASDKLGRRLYLILFFILIT